MKKKVLKLGDVQETSFALIGISSHENDYRLSWALNSQAGLQLKKTDNYSLFDSKNDMEKQYSLYEHIGEEEDKKILLVSNKSEHGFLIPELQNIDFFVVLLSTFSKNEKDDILNRIKKTDIVSMAMPIETANLKSKKNLIFHQYE